MQQLGVKHEMGGTDFKWGTGHHCPPPLATALYVATFTAKSNEIAPSYEI